MSEAANNVVQLIDANKNTNLHKLAARGAVEEIIELSVGEKIDQENYFGWTPLMVAARYGHLKVVKLLLEKRADATKANKYGANVFLMAVTSGNLETIQFLLEHLLSGGLSRRTIATCISPLSLSALFQNKDVMRFLLEKRFDVNVCTVRTGLSPLMFAALAEDADMQKLLLQHGADVNARNAIGETAQELLSRRYQRNGPLQIQLPALQPFEPNMMKGSSVILINTPTFVNPAPCHVVDPQTRKSSNAHTPDIPPTVSPLLCPQIFFPPDFSNIDYIHTPISQYNSNHYIMSPLLVIPSPVINLLNKCISPTHHNMPEFY